MRTMFFILEVFQRNANNMHKHFFVLVFLAGCLFSCHNDPMSQEPASPNIIFLLTDDQRWDAMGAMGNDLIQTPEMDKLAAAGILFRNAFVTTPICCTSRASILSGQYARKHRINDFRTHFSAEDWQNCYPARFKQGGYYQGFVGKYGVGKKEEFPVSDFDYWQGIPGQPMYEHTDEDGNYVHLTRILGDQCLEFLEGVPAGQPFCLSVSFKAPHVQDQDPRQFLYDSTYIDLFADTEIPPAKLGGDEYFEAFPDFFTANNEARRRWGMRFSTPEKYQASVKGYYRLIYGVDVVIGRIRAQLTKLGLAENTIIILMGDNGFFLGEKGLAGKWYAYEESIRVPLVIYDPRLEETEKGRSVDEIALNIDIAPTILQMAGLEIPSSMHGKSLVPLYSNGGTENWRIDFLFEHEFQHPKIPKSEGVISLTEKYFRYLSPAPAHEEWYDLVADADELRNRVGEEDYSQKVDRSKARLEELIELYR